MLNTEMVETSVGAVRIARLGVGPNPLVFVHGYPDNLQIWSKVAKRIAPQHPVVAFDWPGLGWSDPVVSGATPFHLGRHLVAVLDALEIDRAIPVGFDMGGHAVAAAAIDAPERFDHLVLSNFLALGDVQTSWDIAVMRRLGLNRLALGRAPRLVFERALRTFLILGSTLDPATRDDLWSGFKRPPVREHLIKMCAGYQASLPRLGARYADISLPTTVMWSDDDPHFPLVQAEQLARKVSQAQLKILPGLRHWFMWDDPDQVAAVLLEAAGRRQ